MKTKYFCILFLCISYLGIANYAQGADIILYTPKGHTISATTISELTPSEISNANRLYILTYPNATFLADASATYNCHSYAWNMTEGGKTSWLNQSPDLHWYWDDGSYVETAEASAQKIFYNMGDHSAIKSPTHSGMYESKWGSAPRMRHAPNYGPAGYKMDYRKYYKIVLAITGPSMVGGTTSGRYTPKYMPSNTTVTWTYDTNLLTKVSSSATDIVLKPKTATTVGDATVRATFTHSNGVIRDELYDVGVNGPHWKNVQLVVKKSSDGAVVYPAGG